MDRKLELQKGFTIIELMIAMAIIGILAAIAIPNFLSYREKSKIAHAESELKGIELAITDLALDTRLWPTGNPAGDASAGDQVWDLGNPAVGVVANGGGWQDWFGPYLIEVPIDPWGNNYFFDEDYDLDGTDHVVIGSFGPNGVGPNVYDADNILVILQESGP
jgi:prepilin-type N-terminal cleavage/methylation domain-containing protein